MGGHFDRAEFLSDTPGVDLCATACVETQRIQTNATANTRGFDGLFCQVFLSLWCRLPNPCSALAYVARTRPIQTYPQTAVLPCSQARPGSELPSGMRTEWLLRHALVRRGERESSLLACQKIVFRATIGIVRSTVYPFTSASASTCPRTV